MSAQFVLGQGVLDTDLLGPIIIVSAEAPLGSADGNANSLVIKEASASASLGSLDATAQSAEIIAVSASASLGSLTASADTRTPTISVASSGRAFVQPYFAPSEEPVKINEVVAVAISNLGLVRSEALSQITFSIIEDDNEVLLLV